MSYFRMNGCQQVIKRNEEILPTKVTLRLVHPTLGLGTRSNGGGDVSSSQYDKMSFVSERMSFLKIGGGVVRVRVEISS